MFGSFNQTNSQLVQNNPPKIFGSQEIQHPSQFPFQRVQQYPPQLPSNQSVGMFMFDPRVPPPPLNVFHAQSQSQTYLQQHLRPTSNVQQSQPLGQNSKNQQQLQENYYSKPEHLSTEDLEAFCADNFTPGKIPLKMPPKDLC